MRVQLRGIRRRALWLALSFAFLFTCVAILQFVYVRHQIYKTTHNELENWASEVATAAVYEGKWDVEGYRNVPAMVPNWYLIAANGLIVDIEEFIPGLIFSVRQPDESLYQSPQTITSELGEKWLIYAQRLTGGSVVVGISNPDEFKDPEGLLITAARKIGPTLDDAAKANPRAMSADIDYAIISDSGDLRLAWGGIPLRTDPALLSRWLTNSPVVIIDGKPYMIAWKTIYDGSGKPIGTVIVPKDLTLEERALHNQIVFDVLVGSVSWVVFLLLPLGYLVFDEVKRRQQEMTIEEALQTGENQVIEFKRGFIADSLAREIAAFANTNSGNIFLGVDDSGQVVGLSEADAHQRGELLRKLRDITSTKISPRVVTETAFLTYEGKLVLRIFVPRGDQPLYSVDNLFYVRQQNSAEKATPQQIVAIVSKHAG